jgi:pSer/pThr/pTyr-binding forkhead associated (FHA) protein
MKLSLVVLTPGKMEGKSIAITANQFLIGRDPECQLRPASALISKRHCAVILRGNQAFIRDFASTNGTEVNQERVDAERELHNDDHLKVGPLEFRVVLETSPAVDKRTPIPAAVAPAPAAPASSDDEAAAAMLLSLADDTSGGGNTGVDSEGIPTGSTVMEAAASSGTDETPAADGKPADKAKAKVASGNTSSAAKEILEKYMRRPKRERT